MRIDSADNSRVFYEYDRGGKLSKMRYYDDTTSGSESYTSKTYVYFSDGSTRRVIDRGGDTITYAYNGADTSGNPLYTGEVSSVTYADSSTANYKYTADGDIATLSDASGTITYTQDSEYRTASITDVLDTTISYSYTEDLTGTRTVDITYPGASSSGTKPGGDVAATYEDTATYSRIID